MRGQGRRAVKEWPITTKQNQAYVLWREKRLTLKEAGRIMGITGNRVRQLALSAERKIQTCGATDWQPTTHH